MRLIASVSKIGAAILVAAPAGAQAVAFSTVYAFNGGADGGTPNGLIAVNGMFYGTTQNGGASTGTSGGGTYGAGTIFSLTPTGTKTILHSFQGGTDGADPKSGLLYLNGSFYGTTFVGGAYSVGTAFRLAADGTTTVLHNFGAVPGGARFPDAPLTRAGTAVLGTTSGGMRASDGSTRDYTGTVFHMNTAGGFKVIYSFPSIAQPTGALVGLGGVFYGVTRSGGTGSCGTDGCSTVFKVTPQGSLQVIYNFMNGPDGNLPSGSLVAMNGLLYGTTMFGGFNGDRGAVFSLTPSGTLKIVYSFGSAAGDGSYPAAGLVRVGNDLYGTTPIGGANNFGTVFRLTLDGKETVLHSFTGKADGGGPNSVLIYQAGVLYGTTANGGAPACAEKIYCGVVYRITP